MTVPTPAQARVLALLSETDPMSGAALTGKCGWLGSAARTAMYLLLNELHLIGWVSVDASGPIVLWTRTPAGTAAMHDVANGVAA